MLFVDWANITPDHKENYYMNIHHCYLQTRQPTNTKIVSLTDRYAVKSRT